MQVCIIWLNVTANNNYSFYIGGSKGELMCTEGGIDLYWTAHASKGDAWGYV